jgi:sulfatase maturation enzyme AslB (radical SAM superfamily)
MEFLSREAIAGYLREVDALGVKEVYFTGGEPFLHKEMVDILEDTLAVAPATVLTNGVLITERIARALGELAARARYSLEIRISMDHPDEAKNDAVRGPGTHAKALRAVLRLQEVGLLPIVTATEFVLETCRGPGCESAYDEFLRVLFEAGVKRPRLKVLPVFRTGKLKDAAHGGAITESMMAGMDPMLLQCAETRVVTAQGVYACPILVGKKVALMTTETLAEGLGPVDLSHPACMTCFETGMTCGNF